MLIYGRNNSNKDSSYAYPTHTQENTSEMTYVVAEPCVNCRYTDCALVCPVEAFISMTTCAHKPGNVH